MNNVILSGNLTRDCEARYTKSAEPMAVVQTGIAVKRSGKKDETDFFNLTAFGKTAEFMNKYLSKGRKVIVRGELRQNTWEKDGQKHSSVEVLVNEIDFADSKPAGQQEQQAGHVPFVPAGMEQEDEDLPF